MPVALRPAAYALVTRNGIAIGSQDDNPGGCYRILSGQIEFVGIGRRRGEAIVTLVLQGRSAVETVVDTASFVQTGRELTLSFPMDSGSARTSRLSLLDDGSPETASSWCYPGAKGATRDITKRLRYVRTS